MTAKLDHIDKQIVDLLTVDGRMSCADIAREIGGITERTVRYRLERLIAEKVIIISAIVDPKALGYPVVADVFIEVEPGQVQELAYKLADYEIVTYVACATGERDISIQIVARDNQELYRFVTEVVGRIPGVRRTTTSIVPLVIKDDARWRIPEAVFKNISRL
jgi:Lrp/AsnC family transcriptional regulator, regulator for asnA, asnC and gidA